MITILGTKITVFMLYVLVSLQLIVPLLIFSAYKLRKFMADGFPVASVILTVLAAFFEIALMLTMGHL